MKKLITLIALIVTTTINAQAPQGFNYQATVRNSAGALIVNQNVYFKFNVMLNSATSVPVFTETHYVPTDDLGQVNLVIGQGTASVGSFSTINWGTGNYYLGIELNTGSGYVAMGTTQLLSVPYALYANSAGNTQAATPNLADVLAVNNGANNLQIKNLADPTDAQDAVTKSFSEAQLQSQVAQLQAQIDALVEATTAPMANVTIGTQIWSSTNLDVTTYRDGTPIPQVTDPTQWANLTTGAWCYYNNDPANGAVYGKLYNWYAVAGIHDAASLNNPSLRKQFAPQGWHIPSDAEWTILTDFLGGNAVAGGKMKAISTLWQSPNLGATNESGFTGFPGGYRSYDGIFNDFMINGNWWSSSEGSSSNVAWTRYLHYNDTFAGFVTFNKIGGFSVRCLKD
ncbi:fibrobacter succinogenes major paralogous domain-containing protein [Flavobacterium sp.]|jgi:uncharacterized protein (TIGR02145 family)|uniref:fibrobacter succinogenes major paralogous domain-containing protein n=1 Tax=Flavobacterium sp. TaxID=239 RepID=UPI0037C0FEFF